MKGILLALTLAVFGGVQWFSNVTLPEPPSIAIPQVTAVASASTSVETRITQREKVQTPTKKKIVAEKPPTVKPTPPPAPLPSTPPAPTSTPPIPPTPSTSDYGTQIEQEVLTLTNKERVANGLAPLALDTKLAGVARGHSTDMLVSDYFSHENKSGCSSSCRVTNAGYVWSTVGENIYMMSGYKLTALQAAEMIVQGWMKSPGHRANILREAFTHTGVGIAVQGTSIYATTVYAKPR